MSSPDPFAPPPERPAGPPDRVDPGAPPHQAPDYGAPPYQASTYREPTYPAPTYQQGPAGYPGYGPPPPATGYGSVQPSGQFGQPAQLGPPGRVRGTGFGVLMFVITLGIYSFYWYFVTHDEMKKHSGQGLGGGLALLLAVLVGFASPFLFSHEVGELYRRAGRTPRVTALTGLWVIPGFLLLVLPLVWFVKSNSALNDYWRDLGARG